MDLEQEKEHWRRLIRELQAVMTIAEIADALDVEDRQVWRWKAGERIPRGRDAVAVYSLHVKRCPDRQCLTGHIFVKGTGIAS